MYISRVSLLARLFLPRAICRIDTGGKKIAYLTFDDGPIPETTPYILDTLKKYGLKATFFCVGENVKKYPELYQRILAEGHFAGNHTFNHLKGWKTPLKRYIDNVDECAQYVSSDLFRPPYGKMTLSQYRTLKNRFQIVYWDVLPPDYDVNISAGDCLNIVKKKTRPGSVLVFHDNLKAKNKLPELLPGTLDFLILNSFEIQPITNNMGK